MYLRANWPRFADGFVDLAPTAELQNSNDTTTGGAFETDRVHLRTLGYGYMKRDILKGIRAYAGY